MATPEDEESSRMPEAQEKMNFLLQNLRCGEAELQYDAEGKVQIVYSKERKIPLSHVDQSKANTIQTGRDANDVKTRVDVCLEMYDAIKKSRAPSGVVLNKDKISTDALGKYMEGKHFERLPEVLGKGNCSGDIVVIKDKKTGSEHAVKTVMISEFTKHEIKAWVDLGDYESFPSLYLFNLVANKVEMHMEKIEHGVTLDDIMNNHMHNLRQNAPELTRPFSLCVFHGLLTAVQQMHNQNWTHRDLHGGNVMIAKDTMTLKVLDFGMARPLREDLTFDHRALKNDILNAIRLFCGLYAGQDFGNNFEFEKDIKAGNLRKVLTETTALNQEDRKELLQLIMMTYKVTQDTQQAGYGDTSPVTQHIETQVFPEKTMEVMRKAAAILFPDFYKGVRDLDVRGGTEVTDGGGEEEDEVDGFNLEEAAAAIPEDFLRKMNILM